MTVALQARLPMASKLYAVAVGRFAFFTPEPMALSLEGIALRLQGTQARIGPDVPLDLNIHMGDSGICDSSLTPNEILRRAVSALHEAISQGHRFTTIMTHWTSARSEISACSPNSGKRCRETRGYIWSFSQKFR